MNKHSTVLKVLYAHAEVYYFVHQMNNSTRTTKKSKCEDCYPKNYFQSLQKQSENVIVIVVYITQRMRITFGHVYPQLTTEKLILKAGFFIHRKLWFFTLCTQLN